MANRPAELASGTPAAPVVSLAEQAEPRTARVSTKESLNIFNNLGHDVTERLEFTHQLRKPLGFE